MSDSIEPLQKNSYKQHDIFWSSGALYAVLRSLNFATLLTYLVIRFLNKKE